MDNTPEVWTADLDESGSWPDLRSVLTAEELFRADRFHQELDRVRWIRGRYLARTILAEHLGVEPEQLTWTTGPEGKPAVHHARAPVFNVSHSGAIFVMALHEDGPVGIDVELVRPVPNLDSLLSEVLSPSEELRVGRLHGSQRLLAFYRCWTAKEAILKCIGCGLNAALQDIVLANAGEPGTPVVESISIAGWHRESFQAIHLQIDHKGSWSPTQVQCTLVWQGVPGSPVIRQW